MRDVANRILGPERQDVFGSDRNRELMQRIHGVVPADPNPGQSRNRFALTQERREWDGCAAAETKQRRGATTLRPGCRSLEASGFECDGLDQGQRPSHRIRGAIFRIALGQSNLRQDLAETCRKRAVFRLFLLLAYGTWASYFSQLAWWSRLADTGTVIIQRHTSAIEKLHRILQDTRPLQI
jgi:hypothetical protein